MKAAAVLSYIPPRTSYLVRALTNPLVKPTWSVALKNAACPLPCHHSIQWAPDIRVSRHGEGGPGGILVGGYQNMWTNPELLFVFAGFAQR